MRGSLPLATSGPPLFPTRLSERHSWRCTTPPRFTRFSSSRAACRCDTPPDGRAGANRYAIRAVASGRRKLRRGGCRFSLLCAAVAPYRYNHTLTFMTPVSRRQCRAHCGVGAVLVCPLPSKPGDCRAFRPERRSVGAALITHRRARHANRAIRNRASDIIQSIDAA
jgi:hypothetical protein